MNSKILIWIEFQNLIRIFALLFGNFVLFLLECRSLTDLVWEFGPNLDHCIWCIRITPMKFNTNSHYHKETTLWTTPKGLNKNQTMLSPFRDISNNGKWHFCTKKLCAFYFQLYRRIIITRNRFPCDEIYLLRQTTAEQFRATAYRCAMKIWMEKLEKFHRQ